MTEIKRTDFEKICRTCLLEKEDMESIFNSDTLQMLMSFTNIKVIVNEIPNQVCGDCTKEIFRCFQFKQQCEQNDQQLKKTKITARITEENDSEIIENTLEINEIDEPIEPETKLEVIREIQDTKDEVYSCLLCGKQFSRKNYLHKHLKRHTSTKTTQKLSCHICGKLVVNLQFHIKLNHSTNKPYKCTDCDQSFPWKHVLSKHIKFHHQGQRRKQIPRLCTLCGKTVNSSTALKYHMRVHGSENPYECDICLKKFNSSGHLIVHKRVHTGEKPYKCKTCEKCFSTSNTLTKHIRTHTGERPYKCQICKKAFTQSSVLKAHMNVHNTILK